LHLLVHLLFLTSFPTRRSSDLPSNLVIPLLTPTAPSRHTSASCVANLTPALRLTFSSPNKFARVASKKDFSASSSVLRKFVSPRSEEHTSELQSLRHLVCRLLL